MKRNTLLIAVAAAALAVGSGTAFSQGAPHQGGQKSESPSAQSNPASKNAPAEKMQGAGNKSGTKAETNGQGSSERGQKMGQDNKNMNNKSTTGQAPSDQKSGQKSGEANERQNQKMGQEPKSQQKNNKGTTGQAPTQQQSPSRANEPNRMERSGQTNERNERSGQTNERGGASVNERGTAETRGSTSSSASVNLSSEQRTKIHSIIVSERSAPRIARADFDVRVGTVVPRGKVKFAPLPSTIVEIEPKWRGYEYFLVGDQIVVVDPATLRIVAVVPA